MLNIAIFGAPGAGKGTQAQSIIDKYNLKYISTGNILRSEIAKGTPLGLEAKAKVDTATVQNVVRIPVTALGYDEGGDYVFVSIDKKAVKRYVETGLTTDDMTEIVKGLSEGDCVIWNDSQELTDGANIKMD